MARFLLFFIATSDEAIIILLSHPDRYIELIVLIAIKFVLAVIVGYSVDLIFNKQKFEKPHLECLSGEKEHCHNHHNHCEHCNSKDEKEHHECCCSDNIFVSAIKQTLEIFVFLLIANIVLSLIMYFVGEQNVQQILVKDSILLPFVHSANWAYSELLCQCLFGTNVSSKYYSLFRQCWVDLYQERVWDC